MTESARKIYREALRLSATERALLIEVLISSLDQPDGHIDKLWAKEAEERLKGFRNGKIPVVSAEQLFADPKRA